MKKIVIVVLFVVAVFLNNPSIVFAVQVNVTLRITAVDAGSGVTQMMVSNSPYFIEDEEDKGNTDDGTWIDYVPKQGTNYVEIDNWRVENSKYWLSDSHQRTVYVKFKDAAGNESQVYKCSIDIYNANTIEYAQVNKGGFYTNNEEIMIYFRGDSTYNNVRFSDNSGRTWRNSMTYSGSDWETPYILTPGDGMKNIIVKVKDNQSKTITKVLSITLDRTPPVIKNITILPQSAINNAIVSADFSDDTSGICKKLYEQGIHEKSFFKSHGVKIDGDSFSVDSNGTYTIYTEDMAGNGTTQIINVNNIDNIPPVFDLRTGTLLDDSKKKVTLTFSENVESAFTDKEALKNKVSFAADGIRYGQLGINDKVEIENGKIIIIFDKVLSGNRNKIRIEANTLKDYAGNIMNCITETDSIDATKLSEVQEVFTSHDNGSNESNADRVPYGSVLIGNTAYNFDYVNNKANIEEMRNLLVSSTSKNIYVKDFDGVWIDNVTSKIVDKALINVKLFKDHNGNITEYNN